MILLEECSENHKKAKGQVDIQGLHVRYLWQGPKKIFVVKGTKKGLDHDDKDKIKICTYSQPP